MTETIAWVLAAFTSNPGAEEDVLAKLLEAHGVPPALAGHAVAMLQLAFGRQILTGIVTLPDEVHAPGGPVMLSGDAVFAAAAERAARATPDELRVVGLRSAEVNAVNAALNAGSKPGDLVLASTVPAVPDQLEADPAWAARGLASLVDAHGSRLAWSARVYPGQLVDGTAKLQLDVVAPVPGGSRAVLESFAGFGSTIADATADALGKFATASLHVLLAVLEREELGGDQVTWEDWGPWRACIGPLLRQWSSATSVDFASYLDAVKAKLLAEPLPHELHWQRTFIAIGTKIFGFDALLDNDTWPAGADLLTGWPWPRTEDAYALRHLIALVPRPAS